MSNIGLHFNGVNTYGVFSNSGITSVTSWEVTITFATTSTKSGSAVDDNPCIFGWDYSGSRDFHIDIKAGNLYILSGLGGTNDGSNNDI